MRTKYPIHITKDKNDKQSEIIFNDIMNTKEKSNETIYEDKVDWISKETYILFKKKSMSRRSKNKSRTKDLGKLVQKSLRNDRKNRVMNVANRAEMNLKDGNVVEAYHVLSKWYREQTNKTTNPTFQDIDTIQSEFKELYKKENQTKEEIKTYVNYDINDEMPNELEIIKALNKLKNGKSPGASGISVDNLKSWYKKARILDEPKEKDIKLWKNVVNIIQRAFTEGEVPNAFTNGT